LQFFRLNFDYFSSQPPGLRLGYLRKTIAAAATKVFRELRSSWAVHFRRAALIFGVGCLWTSAMHWGAVEQPNQGSSAIDFGDCARRGLAHFLVLLVNPLSPTRSQFEWQPPCLSDCSKVWCTRSFLTLCFFAA